MSNIPRILVAGAAACRSWGTAALLVGGLMVSGCGQKGPLFMPIPASTAHSAVTAPAMG